MLDDAAFDTLLRQALIEDLENETRQIEAELDKEPPLTKQFKDDVVKLILGDGVLDHRDRTAALLTILHCKKDVRFDRMVDIISCVVEDEDLLHSFRNRLLPVISLKYGMATITLVKDLTKVVKQIWLNGRDEYIKFIERTTHKPRPMEFIAKTAAYIRDKKPASDPL